MGIKKYILLNAGTVTRNAFVRGIPRIPYEWYHTKNIALHITPDGVTFLHNNAPIDFHDAYVFTRLRGTDQQFCGMLYDYFRHEGIPASDPINHSYENSAEKISQMLTLSLAGIPVPPSIIFREESFMRNRTYIEEHISFPCIYKTDGSRGRNVHYVESSDALHALVQLKKPHLRALVQPFIENTFDTRTIVAFGEVLGTIKRERTSGYLNNIAQGATPSVYELTKEEAGLAQRAAQVCGIDVAGVDMIHTPKGPVILEVNKSPQINGFEHAHGYKVFEKVAEILERKRTSGYL